MEQGFSDTPISFMLVTIISQVWLVGRHFDKLLFVWPTTHIRTIKDFSELVRPFYRLKLKMLRLSSKVKIIDNLFV